MGNPRNTNKTRAKNQAIAIKSSKPMVGSAVGNGGSGGQVPEPEILSIPLNRLDPKIVGKGRIKAKVVLKLQSGQYEVYLKDERLGSVPGNYTSELLPKIEHQGQISEIIADANPSVTIEVRKIREQS